MQIRRTVESADALLSLTDDSGGGLIITPLLGKIEINIDAAPNASSVQYEVTNLTTGNRVTGTISTDLPASTTFLCWHGYMNNGGTAAAVQFDIMRVYTETDY